MLSSQLDLLLVTETWIKDTDTVFIQTTDLGQDFYKCQWKNRPTPGGGLGIIFRESLQVKEDISDFVTHQFEHVIWIITTYGKSVSLNLIYRPPGRPGQSIQGFTDEIARYVDTVLHKQQNPILLGDFNIHINDVTDSEAMDFTTTMSVLGLDQHVDFTTQHQGNILDLLFTVHTSPVSVFHVTQGPFLSDHCIVIARIGFPRPNWPQKKVTYRKIRDIDVNTFGPLLQAMSNQLDMDKDANGLAVDFYRVASLLLDVFAPKKSSLQTIRPKKPWYNTEIKNLKRKARHFERTWKDAPTPDNWQLYKYHRAQHKHAIWRAKRRHISTKVLKCQTSPRELYSLTKSLTGCTKENPLPEGFTTCQLAEEFSDFFQCKIAMIRKDLLQYPPFSPSPTDKDFPQLTHFKMDTAENIRKIIFSLSPKSCELDPLPASLFRSCVDYIIEIVTIIVNKSLQQGEFISSWKSSVY